MNVSPMAQYYSLYAQFDLLENSHLTVKKAHYNSVAQQHMGVLGLDPKPIRVQRNIPIYISRLQTKF